ncbi:AfsR/SARP family transcriptional regulator [Rugosimonospora africana]|uniref:SARP family transcriptional regulator n=1 Tax=Rugosimonospora africana TaxID=556532 RepID=A0A8J3QRQ3_9ACTN|nr:BTAD domain-containing putative transcriptional regulator [Rugosimonospora africana]GIH14318.1 SARP family transcriptional regulator [Rugosimonospora africana]
MPNSTARSALGASPPAQTVAPGDPPAVRLLGPIEVVGPAGPATLSGTRQRALLGLLALHAPMLVPRTRLIDALWGEDLPRTAVKTLHSHIARIRQALDECGLPGILVTRDPGYLLAIAPEDVDAHRFEAAVRDAQRDLADGPADRAAATLRANLALWRGDAFADAEPLGWAAAEVDRLHEQRLTAFADLWEAELELGRHVAAVGELERLLVAYPMRERLVGLLMLALYRCGRHADALEAYRRLRAHLAEELGTDPGPDLARLHVRLLRRDPTLEPVGSPAARAIQERQAPPGQTPAMSTPMPVPAQLPAKAGHFVGRAWPLGELDGALDAGDRPGVVVVCGPGGIGKTALAVQWAHANAGRFPDGQIFVDLRGDGPAAMTASEAIGHVLTSLGVPASRIPADPAGQAGLYRSLLHRQRVLIVADNAGSAGQVLPLVPASAGALLLVTARSRLDALATHHSVAVVSLDALHHHEAVTLLRRLLGDARVDGEASHAGDLVELCGRLPLALRIAAAKLVARPLRPIGDLTRELGGDNLLDGLSVEGDSRSVRAVFASAYRVLSRPAARVFRLIGLHPGPTFTGYLAATAAALTPPEAGQALDELAAAHLVAEVAAGRYRFHDLIGVYAAECARRDEAPEDRVETVRRLLGWYLGVAGAANRLIDPGRDRVAPPDPPDPLPFEADAQHALAFLDGERDNLLPIVRYAAQDGPAQHAPAQHAPAQHGHPAVAWQLTYVLTGFYDSRGHWTQRVEMCRWAVRAATGRGGDEGLMRSGLGVAYIMTRRFDEALDELHQALELMRRYGDQRGEAHAYNNIAVAYAGMRRFDEAIEAYHEALTRHGAQQRPLGVALALNNIGDAYVRMGRPELSLEYLDRALAASREIRNARLEAASLSSLGQAHLSSGDIDAALARFGEALAVREQTGDRRYAADTLNHLGRCHLARGDRTAALDQLRKALRLSQEIADQHLEALSLRDIGRVYLRGEDFTAARGYLKLALALRIRTPDPYETATIHRDLSDLEERAGNPGEARGHRDQAIGLYRKANASAEADALAAAQAPVTP